MLKSGGQAMTVRCDVEEHTEKFRQERLMRNQDPEATVCCEWFEGETLKRDWFRDEQLSRAIKLIEHVEGRIETSWVIGPDYDITLGPPDPQWSPEQIAKMAADNLNENTAIINRLKPFNG